VGHVDQHTYSTYEINVEGGRFDFELQLICLVTHMVNYVFYGKMYGRLGALHTWLWWVEINLGNNVKLVHIVLTLSRGRHLYFSFFCVVLISLASFASIFIGL
jgi:hypothetical protein